MTARLHDGESHVVAAGPHHTQPAVVCAFPTTNEDTAVDRLLAMRASTHRPCTKQHKQHRSAIHQPNARKERDETGYTELDEAGSVLL